MRKNFILRVISISALLSFNIACSQQGGMKNSASRFSASQALSAEDILNDIPVDNGSPTPVVTPPSQSGGTTTIVTTPDPVPDTSPPVVVAPPPVAPSPVVVAPPPVIVDPPIVTPSPVAPPAVVVAPPAVVAPPPVVVTPPIEVPAPVVNPTPVVVNPPVVTPPVVVVEQPPAVVVPPVVLPPPVVVEPPVVVTPPVAQHFLQGRDVIVRFMIKNEYSDRIRVSYENGRIRLVMGTVGNFVAATECYLQNPGDVCDSGAVGQFTLNTAQVWANQRINQGIQGEMAMQASTSRSGWASSAVLNSDMSISFYYYQAGSPFAYRQSGIDAYMAYGRGNLNSQNINQLTSGLYFDAPEWVIE